ncbi:MAG: Ppx/GppA family phosphatase [Alphaproteobacteria bacterium]|nr:Ppx/GppA family phosphatase [Alphaproteobacteria bacterium]
MTSGRRKRPRPRPGRYGVVDIGSNSIRLVVFDGLVRSALPLFNEKVLCGLGRDLERTGRIGDDAARLALSNLARFAALARGFGVATLDLVGTAAVRDATNGAAFTQAVRRETGLKIRTLDGGEEARLSALGVVSGMPDADGAMGDLGGASLEIVALDRGRLGRHVTLPIGPLRLKEMAEKRRAALGDIVRERLQDLPWLDRVGGHDFIAVGGAWRALARLHMAQQSYPLHVIHNYSMSRAKAEDFLELIGNLSRDSLERIAPVPRKRLETLPLAALVLRQLLRRAKPERLVFSAYGLREGCLYDRLGPAERRRDPLLASAEEQGRHFGRAGVDGAALLRWVEPVLGKSNAPLDRLRRASALLSDIGWAEHPDYRAVSAFNRLLHLPVSGIDHPGRAYVALAVFTRYAGIAEGDVTRQAFRLLDEDRLRDAFRVGLALRLAYTLAGGSADLLKGMKLSLGGSALKLKVPRGGRMLIGETVERRLEALARALDRKALVAYAG